VTKTTKHLKNGAKQIVVPLMTNVTDSENYFYVGLLYQADDGTLNWNNFYESSIGKYGKEDKFEKDPTWPAGMSVIHTLADAVPCNILI
jgi:hypothetical protein